LRSFIVLASLSLAACSGSGPAANPAVDAASRTFPVRDFTAVVLEGPDEVEVRTGSDFAVTATGDRKALDALEIQRDGASLRIARKVEGWKWPLRSTATITVEMPAIRAASVDGSGMLTLDRAEDFAGRATGSGALTIGMLEGRQASLANRGSGTIAAAGAVDMLAVELKGAGKIVAPQLRAERAAVVVQGSGAIQANVAGPATVSLTGSGSVDLGDMAQCTSAHKGSGTIRCGG
jgi:hypothetical protein